MNTQDALQIIRGVVDAAVQEGVFKTAIAAGRAAQAVQVITGELEQIPQLQKEVEALQSQVDYLQKPAPEAP